ncbi:hypothetical protein [Herbiconiux sp. L3-i23]|uniref:hypothetical protein n=1 Tax=Herbiconiux sp. L3-i23 TaxID=2905871 RepID=UPI002050ACE0|nr:hypothetical protein [Herbiconiux sp. L3-i23]BDI24103.1 hypothetical protein L3i23_28790 [Herbiconiux sp. L3-i23]
MALTDIYKKTPAYRMINSRSAKTLLTISWVLYAAAVLDLARGIVLIATWRGGPDLFYGIVSLLALVYLPWVATLLRRMAKEKQAEADLAGTDAA